MRILLISTSYNTLTQLIHAKLRDDGHMASVTLSLSDAHMRNAVRLYDPELIICPFLKEKIPADIYEAIPSVIIHPGIVGDRGPSSLDWAILEEKPAWGVTALLAVAEFDAGRVWGTRTFPMRFVSKASIYRHEVAHGALSLVDEVIEKFSQHVAPVPQETFPKEARGTLKVSMKQSARKINWDADGTEVVLRKMYSAESSPGVLDTMFGEEYYLFGAHKEGVIRGGVPGAIIGRREKAILRATRDGAIWFSHLKKKGEGNFKLPATAVLPSEVLSVPEYSLLCSDEHKEETYRDMWYEEKNGVGYLTFDLYGGAMGVDECRRLREALAYALSRPPRVLVISGGREFWSNGVYLHEIEADPDPGKRSWENINAIDDLVRDIILAEDKLILSAVYGSAGAGGAIMALAGDVVYGRSESLFNPHYRAMGLYGSEYWTYLLPRRVGKRKALELTHIALPVSAKEGKVIGMLDEILPDDYDAFCESVRLRAEALANDPQLSALLARKKARRAEDEKEKPLAEYRREELDQMKKNFAGQSFGGVNYHKYRHRFVHKLRPEFIPPNLM